MTGESIPEEYKRFYSNNPYEILGVSSTVTREEIDVARKKLLRKFHPDVNKDSLATEISQHINQACDILIRNFENQTKFGHATSAQKPSERPNPYSNSRPSGTEYSYSEPRETSKEDKERLENKFYTCLGLGPEFFEDFIKRFVPNEIAISEINRLLKTDKAREILKEGLKVKLWIWGADNPDLAIKFANDWKALGVNIFALFNSPIVKDVLYNEAIRKVRLWGQENSDSLRTFVESWKKVGVDLSDAIKRPEVTVFLHDRVRNLIIVWKDKPGKFFSFVQEYKKVGVDLTNIINSGDLHSHLTQDALFKLQIRGQEQFHQFVNSWVNVGWKPNRDILDKIKK